MTNWNDVANEMNANSGGSILFLKDGKTTIKIIAPENAHDNVDTSWFTKFEQTTEFKGEKGKATRFIVYAIDMSDKEVYPVLLPKTVMNGILNLLAEGHRLLDIDNGFPVSIVRSKSGNKTDYSVMPAAKSFDSSEYSTTDLLSFNEVVERLNKPKDTNTSTEDDSDIKW
jgi:hypothetical protein